jgi:hypothetical protein
MFSLNKNLIIQILKILVMEKHVGCTIVIVDEELEYVLKEVQKSALIKNIKNLD